MSITLTAKELFQRSSDAIGEVVSVNDFEVSVRSYETEDSTNRRDGRQRTVYRLRGGVISGTDEQLVVRSISETWERYGATYDTKSPSEIDPLSLFGSLGDYALSATWEPDPADPSVYYFQLQVTSQKHPVGVEL